MSGWTSIRNTLEALVPSVAGAVTGPAGPIVQGLLSKALGVGSDPSEVSQALAKDPDAAVKIKAIEAQIIEADKQADAAVMIEQQKTFQAEGSGSGGWLQNNYHALGCLWVIWMVTGVYLGIPLLHQHFDKIVIPQIPYEAWMMLGAILGVATWHKEK